MDKNKVPFLDLAATYIDLKHYFDDAFQRVMTSGSYLLGNETANFEKNFASFVGAEQTVGVASGLDALLLAFKALKIGPGDEVIVPTHTFIATWLAVSATGATVVAVEPDPETFCITAQTIESVVTDRTAAIVPVHLYGLPCEMSKIEDLGVKYDVPIVADAAQSHGASIAGKPVGSFGTMSTWSFYPGKNLGAFADAGAVTTDSDDLANRLRSLRNYGSQVKYVHNERGHNSRLDELQAAFLSVKLERLNEWNTRRRAIANHYFEGLRDLPVHLPFIPNGYESAWHLFVIRSSERDALQEHLSQSGIETLIHYPTPIHRQVAYQDFLGGSTSFPIAEELARTVLSLPIGPHMNDEHVEMTIHAVRRFFD